MFQWEQATEDRVPLLNPILERQLEDVTHYSLPTLLRYEDRNSMAASVESRLPFMDYRLVELGLALPACYKLKDNWTKKILRDASKEKVLDEIRTCKFKRGFDVPTSTWIKLGIGEDIRNKILGAQALLKSFDISSDKVSKIYSDSGLSSIKVLREATVLSWLADKEDNKRVTKEYDRYLHFQQFDHLQLFGREIEKYFADKKYNKYVPFLVKVSPDGDVGELDNIIRLLLKYNIDGVIATNTTLARDEVAQSYFKDQAGGLSGEPLRLRALKTQQYLYKGLKGKVPIIGVGGIMEASDGKERINQGAELIQIYSGLIFKGHHLIHDLCEQTRQE